MPYEQKPMMNFNPKELYAGAVKAYGQAEKEGSERSDVLRRMYDAAVKKLGYTQKQLANNDDKQKEVLKLMFSDEIAGNKEVNTLLGKSPFYTGLKKDTPEHLKAMMHEGALGLNYTTMLQTMNNYGLSLDMPSVTQLLNRAQKTHTSKSLDAYVTSKIGSSLKDQKAAYSALAMQDGYIGKVDPTVMDLNDVKELAMQSIAGETSRSNLEERVGVEIKKLDELPKAA
jgi:hypothetical protein